MKSYEYYGNAGDYPKRPIKPMMAVKMSDATSSSALVYAKALEGYEAEMVEYNQQKAAYDERKNELYAEFKKDLLEEFGLTNHPKAEQIFSYVWEKGHACGLSDVYSEMSDIVHLFE